MSRVLADGRVKNPTSPRERSDPKGLENNNERSQKPGSLTQVMCRTLPVGETPDGFDDFSTFRAPTCLTRRCVANIVHVEDLTSTLDSRDLGDETER